MTDFLIISQQVQEQLQETNGYWYHCSGCTESNEGDLSHYHYSELLKSKIGSGCNECGGLGAIWNMGGLNDRTKT